MKKRSWLEEVLREFDRIECEDIEILPRFIPHSDHSFFEVRVITWEYVAVVKIISRNFFTFDLSLNRRDDNNETIYKGGSRTSGESNSLSAICEVLLQNA